MKTTIKSITLLLALAFVSACSEQERREVRAHELQKERIEQQQKRILEQYRADLEHETRRRNDVLQAETARQRNKNIVNLAEVLVVVFAALGFACFSVYAVIRLCGKRMDEQTRRHGQLFNAIAADSVLTPEQREKLYERALESVSKGHVPLIGFRPGAGGAP